MVLNAVPCCEAPYVNVVSDCSLVDGCPVYDLTFELGLPDCCGSSGSLGSGIEVLGEDDTYTPVDVVPTNAIEFDHYSGFIVTEVSPGFVIISMWPASCTQDGIVTHSGTQYFGGTKCFDVIELGTNCSLDPCSARLYNSGCGPNEHTNTGGGNVVLDGSPTLNGFQVQSDIYCPNIWVSDICNAVAIQGNTVTATEYFVGATIGWSGTFATGDGRTVTVQFGLITNVV
jgi:hypothetical protein